MARQTIIAVWKRAGLDKELLDHFDADARLLGGGGDGMQAALGDDFPDQRLPGGNGPVIEDAGAQDAAEAGESGFAQVELGQAEVQRAEGLPWSSGLPSGRCSDLVERRAYGGLALARDVEAGRVIGAVGAIHVTKVSGTKRDAQESAGRDGEQGLILEPRLVPAALKPTIQPEIVSGRESGRTVKRSRQDVVLDFGEARRDVMPISGSVGPP